jgi:hypothetical protein
LKKKKKKKKKKRGGKQPLFVGFAQIHGDDAAAHAAQGLPAAREHIALKDAKGQAVDAAKIYLSFDLALMDQKLCSESMPTSRFAGSRPVRRRHTAPNSEDEHKWRVQAEAKFATHMSLIC